MPLADKTLIYKAREISFKATGITMSMSSLERWGEEGSNSSSCVGATALFPELSRAGVSDHGLIICNLYG